MMIPLAIPNISGNESRYLAECVESTFVSSVGPFVRKFETVVAEKCGGNYGIATSSGTAALHVSLTAIGVKRDDLVILPAYTFVASANAISQCGALPWLFDIDERSWTLDVSRLAAALKSSTTRTNGELIHIQTGRRVGAVMPVFTLGTPADMAPICELANEFGLPVIVDGAAALGATYREKSIGELGADLTVLSFNGNKTVTCGGGGAVVGNDQRLCDHVRHLTTTARVGDDYHHDFVGYNYRMTNLQAAVGCAQMERAEEFVAKKRSIWDRYQAAFMAVRELGSIPVPADVASACWFSGVVLPDRQTAERLRTFLSAANIEARSFWKPMYLQPPYKDAPRTDMAVSDLIWDRLVTLPCSTGLTENEQQAVIGAVVEFADGCVT